MNSEDGIKPPPLPSEPSPGSREVPRPEPGAATSGDGEAVGRERSAQVFSVELGEAAGGFDLESALSDVEALAARMDRSGAAAEPAGPEPAPQRTPAAEAMPFGQGEIPAHAQVRPRVRGPAPRVGRTPSGEWIVDPNRASQPSRRPPIRGKPAEQVRAEREARATPAAGLHAVSAATGQDDPTAQARAWKRRHEKLRGEVDAYRKRMETKLAGMRAQGRREVFEAILPILDEFDLGIEASAEHDAESATAQGVAAIGARLYEALEGLGLQSFRPIGEPFDPALHEAFRQVFTGAVPRGHVAEVVRRGYLLEGQLMRAALVAVEADEQG